MFVPCLKSKNVKGKSAGCFYWIWKANRATFANLRVGMAAIRHVRD
ncbi:hypothetical protein HMPREF0476_0208 [Kingella kingae ATCC 23330]|uniref:Uncharacterized protein n=1 Tax=Kingella kingae ATCC 23330 TaxID=887327 RepID=F5S4S5_KINKI|nr:hypothetical protein HMPREF0476_0208 [Kingella kingae ATCC 23330]